MAELTAGAANVQPGAGRSVGPVAITTLMVNTVCAAEAARGLT